mmetsp:Transcript_26681/g.61794  ORF Transcript_26681/g.61794 Transcript_26681/m.61794 type:complete len:211 (-) Transcript_26681:1017-1649(-)
MVNPKFLVSAMLSYMLTSPTAIQTIPMMLLPGTSMSSMSPGLSLFWKRTIIARPNAMVVITNTIRNRITSPTNILYVVMAMIPKNLKGMMRLRRFDHMTTDVSARQSSSAPCCRARRRAKPERRRAAERKSRKNERFLKVKDTRSSLPVRLGSRSLPRRRRCLHPLWMSQGKEAGTTRRTWMTKETTAAMSSRRRSPLSRRVQGIGSSSP